MRGLADMTTASASMMQASPNAGGRAEPAPRDFDFRLPEAVTALAWRVDGGLWSGAADGGIRLHGADGSERRRLSGHDGGVTALRPRPGTEVLASAGEDGRVCLWEDGDVPTVPMQSASWIEHLAWAPNGRLLAAAGGRSLHLLQQGGSVAGWSDPSRSVLACAWAPDSKRLAIAANQCVHLWRIGAEEPARLLEFPGAALSLAWRGDGRALAAGTQDGLLQVWRQPSAGKRAAGARLTMRGYPAKVHCLDWHPRRSRVATAGGSDVVVWDIPQTGPGRARPLRAHDAAVTALGYGPDGSVLASADRAGRVCLWRDGGDLLQTYVLGAEIAALAWSPDGRALALGCTDGRLHVQAPGG